MNAATSMMLELEWSFGLGGLAPATSRASAATGPRPPFVGAWDPLALLLTGSRTHGGLPWRWEELG